jgi:hypothetical protein
VLDAESSEQPHVQQRRITRRRDHRRAVYAIGRGMPRGGKPEGIKKELLPRISRSQKRRA